MAQQTEDLRFDSLSEDEIKLATVLLRHKKMTDDQLDKFVKLRNKSVQTGKHYLGDMLIERRLISKKTLEEFFRENNKIYLQFCELIRDRGFLNQNQYDEIMKYKESKVNVVTVVEKLGIMTKESFMKLFANMMQYPRLGEWLVAKKKMDKAKLNDVLSEQNISHLEEYVVYHKIIDREVLERLKQKLGLF